MKNVAFILTMPGNNSWNGKWSGDGKLFAKVRSMSSAKKNKEKLDNVLKSSPYYHRWEDGWVARVDVKMVDTNERKKLEEDSKGFCGYDWMIDSIIKDGIIKTD
jgi:hypothetical protein